MPGSETYPFIGALFRQVDEFGPLHIIVSDGNIDDHHLDACQPATPQEHELLKLLRELEPEQRDHAWTQAWMQD